MWFDWDYIWLARDFYEVTAECYVENLAWFSWNGHAIQTLELGYSEKKISTEFLGCTFSFGPGYNDIRVFRTVSR